MSTHPTGARRPDMAAELERVAACARRAEKLHSSIAGVSVGANVYLQAATRALNATTVGTHRDVVVAAIAATIDSQLDVATTDAVQRLSAHCGLPARALRTEAGWRKALIQAGIDPSRLETIEELPGTELVVLLHRARQLVRHDRTDLRETLNRTWEKAKRRGGFDATVTRLRADGLDAEEAGWAVIGFETHKHVNLIWHQANKLERSFPERSAADMLSYGWMGLRTALRLYDPDRGFAFSTYACTRITGAIRDGVRAESPVPKRLGTFGRKVAAAEAELTQSLGRTPTLEEVSAHLGTELEKLALVPRLSPEGSVDEILEAGSSTGSVPSWMVEDCDPADAAEAALVAEAIEEALARLPRDEAEAVKLLVMDELHPTRARQLTGATARQMRNRRDRGLETLRDFLADWSPSVEPPAK